jgi:hypothetical protein
LLTTLDFLPSKQAERIHPSKYIFHYSVTSSRFGTKTN